MKAFVDTSAWFAAANVKDRHNQWAIELLSSGLELITSTFVLVETWLILQSKMSFAVAEEFAGYVRLGAAKIEPNENHESPWARKRWPKVTERAPAGWAT